MYHVDYGGEYEGRGDAIAAAIKSSIASYLETFEVWVDGSDNKTIGIALDGIFYEPSKTEVETECFVLTRNGCPVRVYLDRGTVVNQIFELDRASNDAWSYVRANLEARQ